MLRYVKKLILRKIIFAVCKIHYYSEARNSSAVHFRYTVGLNNALLKINEPRKSEGRKE